jgi:K+-transporting ATPase A subunit
MEGRPIRPVRAGRRLEGLIYGFCGIDPAAAMGCKHYAFASGVAGR